ncbi:MAG: hypothetical protein A3F80_07455 [Candidatus Melainabacteria bacterium RIFCSPLOWO2_12_FULL_35_11]|nr:MAG: hypothetical protein A3F80_07455 [Candidatus Melainabacteria bacterium RIFCSPLOWO2_12_FULL_35_11]
MSSLDKNMSMNHLTPPVNLGKKPIDLSKASINSEKQNPQLINTSNLQQIRTTPNPTLINTNSNITINQPVLNNPVVNQAALNTVNIPQLTVEVKNISNNQIQSTPVQGEFKGPADLPAYAGIANMSLKSWISQNNNYNQGKSDVGKTQLASLFEAIKGFEKKNYEEEFEDHSTQDPKSNKKGSRKNWVLLPNIFSSREHSGVQETELVVNISNFKKLGKRFKNEERSNEENLFEFKLSPPVPAEVDKQKTVSHIKIKHLHEMFALPQEFPECLRLFSNEHIEINPQYFRSFLLQRLKIVEEHLFTGDKSLNKAIESLVPLINQNESHLLLPLVLLYYPLPLPILKEKIDFIKEWKISKKEKREAIIASCEIYYASKVRGRFLIKFELTHDCELSVDIQTAKENNGIAKDIELAIEEGMFLLEKPPRLSELNVLLTGEIYKATDTDEELSIVSTGPLRLEIIIAAYSALTILNKLNKEPDPAGLIEMSD